MTKPTNRFTLHVSSVSPLPKSHIQAKQNLHWENAMKDEFNAPIKNGTWVLVPRPPNVNVVRSMWLFKHKFNTDGTLSMYKARLVANVLSLVMSRQWPIHQLDVKNAFLHGHLTETLIEIKYKRDMRFDVGTPKGFSISTVGGGGGGLSLIAMEKVEAV
ncbi:ribonuclease H-like domain-containing protein [Tanacetum coccineum]